MTTEAASSTPGTDASTATPQAQPGQPVAEGTTVHSVASGVAVSPDVGAWLESQGVKAARMEDYTVPHADERDYSVEADRLMRGWVASAGFSQSNGVELLAEIDRANSRHERMTAAERDIHRRSEETLIRKVLGPDADARLNLARQLVDEIDEARPGFKQLLDDTGAGNSARLLLLLANQAMVLAGRHQQQK